MYFIMCLCVLRHNTHLKLKFLLLLPYNKYYGEAGGGVSSGGDRVGSLRRIHLFLIFHYLALIFDIVSYLLTRINSYALKVYVIMIYLIKHLIKIQFITIKGVVNANIYSDRNFWQNWDFGIYDSVTLDGSIHFIMNRIK